MSASTTPPDEDTTGEQGRRLGEEMRLLLDVLAERAQPWLQQIAVPRQGGDGEHSPTTCDWCPVCAAVALVRGEHSELAARAAEHVLGLLALVRAGLAAHDHAGHHQHHHAGAGAGGGGGEAADRAADRTADYVSPTGPTERAEGPLAGQPGNHRTEEAAAPSTGSAAEDAERASRVQRIAVHRRTGAGAGPAAGSATAASQGTAGAASSATSASGLARSGAGAAGSEAEC